MSRHPSFDIVLFDLGGVLIELGGMGEMAILASESNEDEIWRRWLTCPWVRRFERGECDTQSFAEGMVNEWSMPVGPDEFLAAFTTWPKGLLPGAGELVRAVSEKGRVACLSNTNAVHTARSHDDFRLHELFDELYYSHEIGLVKPDRAAFDFTVERLGVPANRVLFLDDNQINVEGARAAGLAAEKTVGVAEARALLAKLELL